MAPAECVVVSVMVQAEDPTDPPSAVGGPVAGDSRVGGRGTPMKGARGGAIVLQLSSAGWRLAGGGMEAPLDMAFDAAGAAGTIPGLQIRISGIDPDAELVTAFKQEMLSKEKSALKVSRLLSVLHSCPHPPRLGNTPHVTNPHVTTPM